MKFFETLLSGLKAIILSHSYSKAESDQRYGQNGRSDWNENDKSSNAYIKNRPFYEVLKETVLVDNLTFADYNNGNAPGLTFVVGQSYDVAWNGKLYEGLICYNYSGYRVIAGSDMGYPFYIDDDGGNGLWIDSEDNNWTVSITTVQSTVQKIPLKYLPEMSSVGKEGSAEGAEVFNRYDGINAASGEYSHAEGNNTTASGESSHAEGNRTTASGFASHSENSWTTASGDFSHAEGGDTIAAGAWSHAEGLGTLASSSYQHTQGTYNIEDANGKYVHIVGNGGHLLKRSNAHTLDWSGNAWFAGKVYVGGTGQDDSIVEELVTKSEVESLNSISKFCVPINDSVTGKQYYLTMRNGQLVSQAMVTSIEITKLPDRLDYIEGEVLDPTGMVVVATYEDGTTEELPLAQWVNSVPITGVTTMLSYEQGNNIVSTTFNVNIT